ncbi:MAG: GNAT family N-acetyltransferase [Xanthomonadaceae bacterium]|nr:GNAT family N-acetyltransferase [Xanthomonadaceae bacterium]
MKHIFRTFKPSDLPLLHALNESEVPHVGTLMIEKLTRLAKESVFLSVGESEAKEFLGFILCFDERSNYESPNFQWFKARYPKFTYIDRIAVSKNARGQGVGKLLYEEVKKYTKKKGSPLITCEVNLVPPNEASMKFHSHLGFKEVGTQSYENNTKAVTMLTLSLL